MEFFPDVSVTSDARCQRQRLAAMDRPTPLCTNVPPEASGFSDHQGPSPVAVSGSDRVLIAR